MTAHALQPALPGYESMRRVWHHAHQCYGARIMPGEYYVTKHDELIATTLGSCVSACIRDPSTGIGGMNHFMLPADDRQDLSVYDMSARYGNFAMEHMINDILKHGGRRERLEVKVFGGGNVLPTMTEIGTKNIHFVREYLSTEGFRISAEDLGGDSPRKVIYFPATGKVLMQRVKLSRRDEQEITRKEMEYQRSLESKPIAGDIDLF
ncbi:MAG: chemoreceptor glutamine deamidase CheD [Halieaceae bacterium]|jgi:chemotaxis protein CheD|nr:chemoreceptor glutamine deamidase CheD [Halieaceae bacterium]